MSWTRTVLVLVALAALLAVVLVIGLRMLQRDRAELLASFARERSHQLDQASLEIRSDFEKLGDDLRLAGHLAATAETGRVLERELRAFVSVSREYRVVELRDANNESLFSVLAEDGIGELDIAEFHQSITYTTARALADSGRQMRISPAISTSTRAWLRVFAAATPEPGTTGAAAIALVVDTRPFFAKLNILAADTMSRVVVLGAHGMPAPVTDPVLARYIHQLDQHRGELPGFARLIARMRQLGRGELRIDAREARRLGLPEDDVIALLSPIAVQGQDSWSIALLASTAGVRQHDRIIVRRTAVLLGVIVLFLSGASAYLIRAVRRAVAVRERLRHAEHLAHLHQEADQILDAIPTGVMVLAEDGRITALNRMLRDRMGHAGQGLALAEALAAAPVPTPPATVERLQALVAAASAFAHEGPHSLFGVDLELFATLGRYNVHAVPLEQRVGDARVLLALEDLSAVRDLESQLLRTEKLATVGVLAAGIAHEIGTPLSIVRGRAEYALHKLDTGSPHADGQRVIIEQIDTISRIIGQLLDFSRIKRAHLRAVELEPAARSVAELLRFEAERRRATVTVTVAEQPLAVHADPDQLQQVLVNLVMNACDACDACAGGGAVTIAAAAQHGGVRIEVADTGLGIPDEHKNQIFDPFFTTKKRGQGTGLGLSVVSQIVRAHGAHIEVSSEPGRGTRMIIDWPSPPAQPREQQQRGSECKNPDCG